MTDYICKLTLKELCARDIIKEEDIEVYRYGLQLLVATILKGLGIAIIGILTGLLKESIIFILFFSSLRIQAGGYHAKTVINCFIGTSMLLFPSILLLKLLPVIYQPYYVLISMVFSIFFVYLYAPLESENKPLDEEEKILYRRRSLQTVIIGNIIILISMAFSDKFVYYAAIASTGFLLESLTLIHALESEK
ncbi:accessory gene regulator B family protein [uncultured Tissierella sp.]|uniref:accessory gene regulator ArgB-like protein n=1 Tax=uncultured Tissierella sp. TaxID=448160 RepID=UPI0028046A99|nr:accessory gene regulator B family protein [uncultured Tissierella sp.]MDU5080293.1 accessory gene regulator B family protein [Bacillota bacterium]